MRDLETWWQGVISGKGRSLARPALAAASGLYRLGLEANHALYNHGQREQTRPALPTISVGNLSLGGTGKSVAVRYLVGQLLAEGCRPGIILRGHRREDAREVILASDGQGRVAPLAQTGDEAAEHIRALPTVPVAVGKRRERAIELLAAAGANVAVLDDGFQYFRMARDLDLVLVSARMALRTAHLFPRGVLREPWSHLRRADQVWITHADEVSPAQVNALQTIITCFVPARHIILTRHAAAGLVTLEGTPVPLEKLQGLTVVAMSGLGSPGSFECALETLGAQVTPLRLADHYRYGASDWPLVARTAERAAATVVVTTEKDAVKLPEGAPLPVWVLRTELRIIQGEEEVIRGVASLSITS